MKKVLFIFSICLIASVYTFAQSNHFGMYYSIAFPTGDVGEYISKPSFRGVYFDFHKTINENVGIGLSTGWTVFYEEKAEDTYTIENNSLTGKQYRYSNHVPILASGVYYMQPDQTINPFAKLGIGTIYTRRNTDMGQYTYELEAWNFALAPEFGVQYSVGYESAVSLSLKYFAGFQAGNELDASQSYFAINFGFVY